MDSQHSIPLLCCDLVNHAIPCKTYEASLISQLARSLVVPGSASVSCEDKGNSRCTGKKGNI